MGLEALIGALISLATLIGGGIGLYSKIDGMRDTLNDHLAALKQELAVLRVEKQRSLEMVEYKIGVLQTENEERYKALRREQADIKRFLEAKGFTDREPR
ncbi:MAG TPA: hypothetical protein V6C65_18855 [Allocoleopsis sp.]